MDGETKVVTPLGRKAEELFLDGARRLAIAKVIAIYCEGGRGHRVPIIPVPPSSMRVLHVADLHLNDAWFSWVRDACANYDLLVIAGDLQNGFSDIGMVEQVSTIQRWLLAVPQPTIVCSGNHDYWVDRDHYSKAGWLRSLRGQGNIVGVDGDVVRVNGISIAVNGWQQIPELNERVDIVVSHAPPAGCPCAGSGGEADVGDPDLWPAVESQPPELIVSGHIHVPHRYGCNWPPIDPTTVVLVTGCDESLPQPQHWVIDTDRRQAVHSSGAAVSWSGAA